MKNLIIPFLAVFSCILSLNVSAQEPIGGDCDEAVCVIDQDGNIFEMPACLVDLFGLELADTDDCSFDDQEEEEIDDEWGWEFEDCTESEEFVCVYDSEGNIFETTICEAEFMGFELADTDDCPYFGGDDEDDEDWGIGEDCDEAVCVIDQDGNIFEMPACLVDLFGFELADADDCSYDDQEEEEIDDEWGNDDVDWENEDCDEIVCVYDSEGNIFESTICEAEFMGFELAETDDCPYFGEDDEDWENEDCDEIVCAIDPDGNIFEMPVCLVDLFGFELADTDDCPYDDQDEEEFDDEWGNDDVDWENEDCDVIVCVYDSEGNIFGTTICEAEFMGFELADTDDCLGDQEEEEANDDVDQITVEDLEDFGDWVFGTEAVFIDHDGDFFIETAFPNPTEDIINISISSKYVNKVNYIVRSLDGRVVQDEQIVLAEGSSRLQLNLNDQPGGIYMVQIMDNSGFQATTRVVKLN